MSKQYRMQQIEKLLRFFGMWEMLDRQTGTLSAGQATRVMLVKAFMSDPEIVLLDEPTASLDPDIAKEVRHFILLQRKERNVSILVTSHNMDEVMELCDRVLVLKKGTIIADRAPGLLAASISKARIHLTISSSLDQVIGYLGSLHMFYKLQDNYLTVELDEHAVANFLTDLSNLKVLYSQISIDKPTLEDYFLSIAK